MICHKIILWISGLVCDHTLSFIQGESVEPDLRRCSSPGSMVTTQFITQPVKVIRSDFVEVSQKLLMELLGNVWCEVRTTYTTRLITKGLNNTVFIQVTVV